MSRTLSPRRGAGVLTEWFAPSRCLQRDDRRDRHTARGAVRRLGTGGSVGGPGGVGGPADCSAQNPGPSFIRRLNRFEYNNTVRDLLGDTTQPADDFPIEEKRLGFDNNAEALQVSPVLAEQYMLSAEKLAATAVDQDVFVARLRSGQGRRGRVRQVVHLVVREPRPFVTRSRPTRARAYGTCSTPAARSPTSPPACAWWSRLRCSHRPFLYRVEFGARRPASGERWSS